jgi:peptidoglycan/xylan/chitin deacetylase (PgdA/CDA1 family)
MSRARRGTTTSCLLLLGALAASSCDKPLAPSPSATVTPSRLAPPPVKPARERIDGRAFPSKVLALTWDDGPDKGTAELARYLHDEHVVATFFVVNAWVPGVSNEPGEGTGVYETGYSFIDVLGLLTSLGHRVANHTTNHVLLGDAPAAVVLEQLGANQRAIDRYVRRDLRLFRAPGGAWSPAASEAIDGDPYTSTLVGPVHWDIDGKDWEGSLFCPAERRPIDGERAAPGGAWRVKPEVVAARYLDIVSSVDHGIVLFHDRVGHVGSSYAMQIARRVIPELKKRGYVFAAPVLRFGPLEPLERPRGSSEPERIRLGDINGDGRPDRCVNEGDTRVVCALSDGDGFLASSVWADGLRDASRFELEDVNGDGRADLCIGDKCALAP